VKTMMRARLYPAVLTTVAVLGFGCGNSDKNVAPTATALESATPASASALTFSVDPATAKATWVMDAPFEKIFGEIPGLTGDLFIDPADIAKSTGRIDADVSKIDLFQQKRKDEKDPNSELGPRSHNDTQNGHAREWLQIDPGTPEKDRQANTVAQFSIMKVEVDKNDVSKVAGADRKVTGTLSGKLLLHGHKADYSAKFEATFTYEGDKPKKVVVKTTDPIKVSLEEFDIKPHDLKGKTLKELSGKVAESAPVMIEFTANIK
jgi:polyisoprenoid-binding protein YceI